MQIGFRLLAVSAMFSLCCGIAHAEVDSDVTSVQRAALEKIQELSRQIRDLKAEKAMRTSPPRQDSASSALRAMGMNLDVANSLNCPGQPVQACTPDCTVRFASGTCGSYGTDFCAVNASCAANCTVRFANGNCGSYNADSCGSGTTCSPNCTVRFANGTCGSYGPDFCGADAACTPNCTVRFANGTCGSYGPDICN